jgi:hypothetical protein
MCASDAARTACAQTAGFDPISVDTARYEAEIGAGCVIKINPGQPA